MWVEGKRENCVWFCVVACLNFRLLEDWLCLTTICPSKNHHAAIGEQLCFIVPLFIWDPKCERFVCEGYFHGLGWMLVYLCACLKQRARACVLAAFLHSSGKSTDSFVTQGALKTKLCPLCFCCRSPLCWHISTVLIARGFENKTQDQLPVRSASWHRRPREELQAAPLLAHVSW